MTSVLLGPILFSLALILVAAQLMGPRREFRASPRIEARWVLGSGLLFGILATWVLSPVYLRGPACVPDFYEYCQAMLYLDGSHGVFPAKRSQVAGQLPYLLSTRLGILDGLALAGVLCTCVMGACIYTWARLLGGRAAPRLLRRSGGAHSGTTGNICRVARLARARGGVRASGSGG